MQEALAAVEQKACSERETHERAQASLPYTPFPFTLPSPLLPPLALPPLPAPLRPSPLRPASLLPCPPLFCPPLPSTTLSFPWPFPTLIWRILQAQAEWREQRDAAMRRAEEAEAAAARRETEMKGAQLALVRRRRGQCIDACWRTDEGRKMVGCDWNTLVRLRAGESRKGWGGLCLYDSGTNEGGEGRGGECLDDSGAIGGGGDPGEMQEGRRVFS